MIKIICPSCRRVHKKTDESLLGKIVKCKDCGFTFKVSNGSQPVQWYWMQNGQKNGPVNVAGLKELARSDHLKPTDMIQRVGADWVVASQVKGLFPESTSVAVAQPVSTPTSPMSARPTSKSAEQQKQPEVAQPIRSSCADIIEGEMAASFAHTEVPHPPSLAAEARSATMWKCPTCAEEIQKEANKCRFCGMILTKAAKMGYPAFYKNVAEDGLSFTSLLFDYGDFLYPDEEGVNDCCLGAPDMLGNLFDNRDDDQKTKDLKIAGGIIKAMRDRLSDIPAKSQEALTIQAGWRFLWWIRDFAQPCHSGSDPIDDPQALESAISNFTELRQTLSRIEPEGRRDLEQHIDYAIQTCQSQLGTTGTTCSEPFSPSPTQSEAKGTLHDLRKNEDFLDTKSSGIGVGITCYNHHGKPVVASCSQGCGRWLCKECASKYEPPICDNCAQQILSEQQKAIAESRARIVIRIIVNAALLIPYIVLFAHTNASSGPPPTWIVVPVLIWGFWGFSRLLDVFSSPKCNGYLYLVGGLLVGAFGFLVIPFLLVADIVRLIRMRSIK